MEWRYRKRVKVAPGIYMNISKSGVSTTIGGKGSSINIGKNGTYLNTSIPGSGFYNRQKISGKRHGGTSNINNNHTNDNSSEGDYKGCGAIFGIVLAAFGIVLFFKGNAIAGIIALAIGIIILCAILQKPASDDDTKRRNTLNDAQSIEEAKRVLPETRGIAKTIIQNFINCHELLSEIEKEVSITENINSKLQSKGNENLMSVYEGHKTKLEELHNKLSKVQMDADAMMTNDQREAFSSLSEKFKMLLSAEKVWFITSSSNVQQVKSAVGTNVIRRETNIYTGSFDFIHSVFEIPVFDTGTIKFFIYPQFIIKAINAYNFEVFSHSSSNIMPSAVAFVETGKVPTDAMFLRNTWQYVNRDGSPDRRYSNNPQMAVYKYCYMTFSVGNNSSIFMLSNFSLANDFVSAYSDYATSLPLLYKNDAIEGAVNNGSMGSNNNLSIEKATTKLFEQVRNMCNMNQLVDLLNEDDALSFADNLKFCINSRLGLMALLDVLKCYKNMGYELEPSQKEYVALLLFIRDLTSESVDEPTDNKELIDDDTASKVSNIIDVAEKAPINDPGNDKFLVIEVLRQGSIDKEVITKYAVLLYRFATALAKSDGVVTKQESTILSQILRFTSGKEELEEDNITATDLNIDPQVLRAAELVVSRQNGSTSFIQRNLQIGYTAAGKIMDELEKMGIIGPAKGAQPRDVLINDLSKLNDAISKNHPRVKKTTGIRTSIPSRHKGDAMRQLNGLIGLTAVKDDVNKLVNFIKVQQLRQQKGMRTTPISYHCVFTGNPGTGKTTVARIMAEIYRDLGILKKGHLVETDRSGLVAEYVGQTAVKTNKIIDSALDGVLFIDEAYSLVQGGSSDYGMEAIATLLKRMEDDRDRLIVILAGYEDEMKQFINSNPGLLSRFNRYIRFDDYSPEELMDIYKSSLKKYEYTLSNEAEIEQRKLFDFAVNNKDKNFGNGRYARNIMEKTLENQAMRLASIGDITDEMLRTIEAEDIPSNNNK